MTHSRPAEDKVLPSYTPSFIHNIGYKILDWSISPDHAIYISESLQGKRSEQGVMKVFIQELQDSFDVTGSTPDFLAKLIPEYIYQTIKEKMPTGELLRFNQSLENDLLGAYDPTLDQQTQDQYKIRVFKTLMFKLGPHALKHIQSLRPKNSNSWVMHAIATSQSDLPAVSLEDMRAELIKAFRKRGSFEYADHFDDHFNIKKGGNGTVGMTVFLEYKETPESEPEELVAKIIRKNAVQAFLKDNENLEKAMTVLLDEKKISPSEVKAFKRFSLEKLNKELEETNPNLEMARLMQGLYEKINPKTGRLEITTAKGKLHLAGKAKDVIFMGKAKGIELGKYLKNLRTTLRNPALSKEERDDCLKKLFTLREHYVSLTRVHLERVTKNLPVHTDLHAGNIFYDEEHELLTILDLGGVAYPASKEAHLRLRQFLASIYLALGTGDVEYMRLFYKHHREHPEFKQDQLAINEIDQLLSQINDVLVRTKKESDEHHVMQVEQGFHDIMSLISEKVLTAGVSIIPSALVGIARSDQLLYEEIQAIDKDLKGTPYEKLVPYQERTPLAIALFASDKSLFSILYAAMTDHSLPMLALWTPESWDYFVNHCLMHPGGIEQLRFEKKFIYGILGLTDVEAAEMDLLIAGKVISGVVVLALAKVMLEKMYHVIQSSLPQWKLSYQFLSEARKNLGTQFTTFYEELAALLKEKDISRIKDFLKTTPFVANTFASKVSSEALSRVSDAKLVPYHSKSYLPKLPKHGLLPKTPLSYAPKDVVFKPFTYTSAHDWRPCVRSHGGLFRTVTSTKLPEPFKIQKVFMPLKCMPVKPTFFKQKLPLALLAAGAVAMGAYELQKEKEKETETEIDKLLK